MVQIYKKSRIWAQRRFFIVLWQTTHPLRVVIRNHTERATQTLDRPFPKVKEDALLLHEPSRSCGTFGGHAEDIGAACPAAGFDHGFVGAVLHLVN